MRLEYIATRNLAPGHDTETEYEIVVFAESLTRSVAPSVNRQISLDRTRVESDLMGVDRLYNVRTDHIPIGQSTRVFEEFLESVMNGESFTFDPDSDTAATEVSAMSAIMESVGYEPVRTIPGHYQYAFTVRVL